MIETVNCPGCGRPVKLDKSAGQAQFLREQSGETAGRVTYHVANSAVHQCADGGVPPTRRASSAALDELGRLQAPDTNRATVSAASSSSAGIEC